MSNENLSSHEDRWELAMSRIESIDYGTEVIKSVVESFREPNEEMIRIDDLEAFLDEMEGSASAGQLLI